jgi:hypothetical protein|tara:strand:- start:87 stop:677 length:591 start_codon:yes stop_codon:yes gene_type:complete
MKEFKLPLSSLMGAWFIDEKICDALMEVFHKNIKVAENGTTYNAREDIQFVDTKIKDSLDLGIDPQNRLEPFGKYRDALQKVLEKYIKKYTYANGMKRFDIAHEGYNIQSYPKNGGYKDFHFEEGGYKDRCLVFMTYLNTVDDEGETEFLYQNLKIKPKKGLTVIWPAYWTHTHRGIPSKTQVKNIVTGWYEHKDS